MASKSFEDLLLGVGFPAAEAWQRVAKAMEKHTRPQPTPAAWVEWAQGWNSLAYRVLGVHAERVRLAEMLSRPGGDAPPPEERAEQEHRLFAFYAAGVSTFETFAYSMFAFGALLQPSDYPLNSEADKRSVDLPNVVAHLKISFRNETVTRALDQLGRSPDFKGWNRTRNVLSHRGAPGRTISITLGGSQSGARSADWMDRPLSVQSLVAAEEALFQSLTSLVSAAEEFVAVHL